MTEPLPAKQAADAWSRHRPALEALSAELARHDPVLARSFEGALQLRDAILVELVGERVASMRRDDGGLGGLGERIVREARTLAGEGAEARQAGGD